MQKVLRENHEEATKSEEEQTRLFELLEKLEVSDFDQVFGSLSLDEKASFQAYVKGSQAVQLWTPWWEQRDVINDKIEVMSAQVDTRVNLNAVEIEQVPIEMEETKEASDYEDLPDTNEPTMTHESFTALYLHRRAAIPTFDKLLKSKPSESLPYLLVSNLASFVFYSRYHNGALLEIDPLTLSAVLLAQLLDTSNQTTIRPDFESCYFEHLKALKVHGNLPSSKIKEF
jgi:hypothetical protein